MKGIYLKSQIRILIMCEYPQHMVLIVSLSLGNRTSNYENKTTVIPHSNLEFPFIQFKIMQLLN